jgi:hypothetical protein
MFHSRNDFSEPVVIDPAKNKFMNKIAVSSCCRYFVVALADELLLYEIKNTTSVVLFKNIVDLKAKDITHVGFYGDKYENLYFVDQRMYLHLLGVSNALIYVKVDVQKIDICLKRIVAIHTLKYVVDADHYYLFAISSATETAIYMI